MAAKHFIEWVERKGNNLRSLLRLNPLEPLDPFKLAEEMEIRIFTPHDVLGFSIEDLAQLLDIDSEGWSAGTMTLPSGKSFIILNPNHRQTRKRATLMEELSHIYLKHKPSDFILVNGIGFRTYKKTPETEAYWVGSSALLPRNALIAAKENNICKSDLAENYGISIQLVTFRERVTGVKLNNLL